MSLIDKLIQVGVERGVKEAQLYGPAIACYDNPTKGITVINKYAPMVIRDCAYMAKQYIPVMVFNEVSDAINLLRAKGVTEAEIEEFLATMNQVENPTSKGYKELYISLIDSGSEFLVSGSETLVIETPDIDYDNVYGDYTTNNVVEDHTCTDFAGTPADKLKAILIG